VTTANLLAPATATQTVPRIFVNALSGRAYGDISPTIATFLAQYSQRFTDVVIQLGINDASRLFLGTLTIPNLTAQVIAVIAAARVQSPGCNIVLVGPWCHATDDLDVQIAQVNTILLAQVAADLQFIKWSDVPHAGVTTDGTHPDVAGALLLSVPILAVL
jgi:lysophospholipase L1-like esterase